jgi:hypothetical protein
MKRNRSTGHGDGGFGPVAGCDRDEAAVGQKSAVKGRFSALKSHDSAFPSSAQPFLPRFNAAEIYEIKLETVTRGYDGKTCWVHPRAGAIPGPTPQVVLTMQKLLLTGSDVFYALNHVSSNDFGQTWTQPVEHGETLGRREEPGGVIVAACDFTPKWHAKTGKLLGTGHTVRYKGDQGDGHDRPRETCVVGL